MKKRGCLPSASSQCKGNAGMAQYTAAVTTTNRHNGLALTKHPISFDLHFKWIERIVRLLFLLLVSAVWCYSMISKCQCHCRLCCSQTSFLQVYRAPLKGKACVKQKLTYMITGRALYPFLSKRLSRAHNA